MSLASLVGVGKKKTGGWEALGFVKKTKAKSGAEAELVIPPVRCDIVFEHPERESPQIDGHVISRNGMFTKTFFELREMIMEHFRVIEEDDEDQTVTVDILRPNELEQGTFVAMNSDQDLEHAIAIWQAAIKMRKKVIRNQTVQVAADALRDDKVPFEEKELQAHKIWEVAMWFEGHFALESRGAIAAIFTHFKPGLDLKFSSFPAAFKITLAAALWALCFRPLQSRARKALTENHVVDELIDAMVGITNIQFADRREMVKCQSLSTAYLGVCAGAFACAVQPPERHAGALCRLDELCDIVRRLSENMLGGPEEDPAMNQNMWPILRSQIQEHLLCSVLLLMLKDEDTLLKWAVVDIKTNTAIAKDKLLMQQERDEDSASKKKQKKKKTKTNKHIKAIAPFHEWSLLSTFSLITPSTTIQTRLCVVSALATYARHRTGRKILVEAMLKHMEDMGLWALNWLTCEGFKDDTASLASGPDSPMASPSAPDSPTRRRKRHTTSIGSEGELGSGRMRRSSSVASISDIGSPLHFDEPEKLGSDDDIPDVYKILEFLTMAIWGWATLAVENAAQKAETEAERKVQIALSEGAAEAGIANLQKRAIECGIDHGIPDLLIQISRLNGSDQERYRGVLDNEEAVKMIDYASSGAISTASIVNELANCLLTSGVTDILLRLLFSTQVECRECAGAALVELVETSEEGALNVLSKGGVDRMLDVLDPGEDYAALASSHPLMTFAGAALMHMSFFVFSEVPVPRIQQTINALQSAIDGTKEESKVDRVLEKYVGCALWRFCFNQTNCSRIGKCGGIPVITRCAFNLISGLLRGDQHTSTEDSICLLEFLTSALWLLSYDDHNADLMVLAKGDDDDVDAIITLVNVISLPHIPRYDKLHEDGVKALWTLSTRLPIARATVDYGAISQLQKYPPENMVLASGLLLVLMEDAGNRRKICEMNGEFFLEQLMVEMVKCDRPELQTYGSMCLARMAMDDQGRHRIAENGCTEALLGLVNKTAEAKTQVRVLQALLNLSVSNAMQAYICKHGLYHLLETAWTPTCAESRMIVAGILHNLKNNPSNRSAMYRAELHVKATMEQANKGLLLGTTFSHAPRSPTSMLKKEKKKKGFPKRRDVKSEFLDWLEEEVSTRPSALSAGKSQKRPPGMPTTLPQLKVKGSMNSGCPSFDYVPNFSTEEKSEVLLNYEIQEGEEEPLFALPKLSQKMRHSMKSIYLRGLDEPEDAVDATAAAAFWHRGPKNVERLNPGSRKVNSEMKTSRGTHHWKLKAPAYYWRSYRQDVDSYGVQMHTTHQVLLDHDSMPAPPVNDEGKMGLTLPEAPSMPGLPESGKPFEYTLPPPPPPVPHKHTIVSEEHACQCLIQQGDALNKGWDPAPVMGGARLEYSSTDAGPCGMFGIPRDHHVVFKCAVKVVKKEKIVEVVEKDWVLFKKRLKTADSKSYYDDDLFDEMCLADWGRVVNQKHFLAWLFHEKICNIAHDEEAQKEVLDAIQVLFMQHYRHIMYAFQFYSAMGNSNDLSQMLFNQCMDMLGDMGIPEDDNKAINKGALDRLFVEANVEGEEQEDDDVGDANADRALMRFELLELYVRIAVAKFMLTKRVQGKYNGVVEAMTILINDHVVPCTGEGSCNAGLHHIDDWRREHLYNVETEAVLLSNKKVLKAIFDKYKGDENRRLKIDKMDLKSYMMMLRDIKFLNEDFTMRESRLAFVWSRMQYVDEVSSNVDCMNLTFEDFLECLCRIAILKGAPPHEDLVSMANQKIIKAPDIKAWHGVSIRPQQSKLIDRPSGEWGAPWTRTMAEKLSDLLNLLISVFDVDGDGVDEADLEYLEVRKI